MILHTILIMNMVISFLYWLMLVAWSTVQVPIKTVACCVT